MLNDTQIKALKPREKIFSVTDGLGLSIQVETTGSKLWRFRYQFYNQPKLISLGKYPEISLLQARQRRDDARKLVADGVDPAQHRKDVKTAQFVAQTNSFELIAREWHEYWRKGKHSRYADSVLRRLEADVFPVIGNRAISQIQAPEIIDLIKVICERGSLDIAKRTLEKIGQIFRYAIAHKNKYVTRNPAADIKPSETIPTRKQIHYPRVSLSNLPQLLNDINDYSGSPLTRLAMLLMSHIFLRTNELIGGQWVEINLENKRWDVPANRMKMKLPHIVPLSSQVISILTRIKKITGDTELIFPGVKGEGKTMSNNTILKALERMNYKGEMTGHGFRGVASTYFHENDYNELHIEMQLAHAERNKVKAAYNHAKYLSQRTKMMQDYSNFLESLIK